MTGIEVSFQPLGETERCDELHVLCWNMSESACLIPQAAACADVSLLSYIDVAVTRRFTCNLLDIQTYSFCYGLSIKTTMFFGLNSNEQLGRYLTKAEKNPTLAFHPTP